MATTQAAAKVHEVPSDEMIMCRVVALADYQPGDDAISADAHGGHWCQRPISPKQPSETLRFRKGDLIEVVADGPLPGWALGRVKGQLNPWRTGIFPTERTTYGFTGGRPTSRPGHVSSVDPPLTPVSAPRPGQEEGRELGLTEPPLGQVVDTASDAPIAELRKLSRDTNSDDPDEDNATLTPSIADLRQLRQALLAVDPHGSRGSLAGRIQKPAARTGGADAGWLENWMTSPSSRPSSTRSSSRPGSHHSATDTREPTATWEMVRRGMSWHRVLVVKHASEPFRAPYTETFVPCALEHMRETPAMAEGALN